MKNQVTTQDAKEMNVEHLIALVFGIATALFICLDKLSIIHI